MGPVLSRLFSKSKMRAFAFVLLAVAAVHADSDPYTIGQVLTGHTYGGYLGGYAGHLGYANHAVVAPAAYTAGYSHGYSPVVSTGVVSTPAVYHGVHYGKREAEADSDAYTIGQVAAGLPVANAYATGHPHNVGVVTHTSYSAPIAHHGYTSYAAASPVYSGYAGHYGYAGLGYARHGYTGAYYG